MSQTRPTVRNGGGSVREALHERYLRIGSVIDDTYRVLEVLGEGGMGVVLRAHDEHLDRDVAIKFIHPRQLQHAGARTRFETEARAMAAVSHDNVVEVFAFGQIDRVPYFVMEYVAGPDLERWMAKHPKPSLDQIRSILVQACCGVAAIHATGATHRDVKASNVLVGPGLRVAITDLGLVRAIQGQQAQEAVSGTPAYMAPELIRGDAIESAELPRVDVYSLGVIAYELLAGRTPFEGGSLGATLNAHLLREPPSLVRMDPRIPQSVEDAVFAALEKDPAKRLPTARAFRERLERGFDAASESGVGPLLIVVDDDRLSRQRVARMLRREFPAARVECIEDPLRALALSRGHPPAALITGLDMPAMNGVELTAALRAGESTERVPVIVTTGHGGPEDWSVLRRVGADGFLVKPFDDVQLICLLKHLAPELDAGTAPS